MDWFWHTYYTIEKTFFYTLTRKLASLALIAIGQQAILFAVYQAFGEVQGILTNAHIAPPVMAMVGSKLDNIFYMVLGLSVLLSMFTLFMIWYLRYLIVRPVRRIIAFFNEIGSGGDLSHDIPAFNNDELRELSESHNRFLAKLREKIGRAHV